MFPSTTRTTVTVEGEWKEEEDGAGTSCSNIGVVATGW